MLSDNTELSGKDVEVIESSKLADLALLKIDRQPQEACRVRRRPAAGGAPLDLGGVHRRAAPPARG